jgi:WD40 repeat protein
VTGLAFREDTHVLYSGSFDCTVKIWSLDDRAYVDTLYGHQSEVHSSLSLCWWLSASPSLWQGHGVCIDPVKLEG